MDSDDFSVILEHQNEIEALFVDNDRFFCGKKRISHCWNLMFKYYDFILGDDRGGVTCFEDGKLKYTINVVEVHVIRILF